MAKKGYFVMAYRILEYLYRCFMRGDRPNIDEYGPDALGISNGYWVNMMESLSDEGFIKGICFPSELGASNGVKVLDLKITKKGIEFLQENSNISKAREMLKGIKEIIPGM